MGGGGGFEGQLRDGKKGTRQRGSTLAGGVTCTMLSN